MADEPRVARLHLVPGDAGPDGGDGPARVAGLGDLTGGEGEVGGGPADLQLIRGDAGPATPPGRRVSIAQSGVRPKPDSRSGSRRSPKPGAQPQPGARLPPGVRSELDARLPPGVRSEPGARLPPGVRSELDARPQPSVRPESGARPQPGGGTGGRGAAPGSADGGRRPGRGGAKQRPTGPPVDPVAAAKEICLTLLTDRARTKHELAEALRRRDVPDDVAAAVLERFDEVGLIDDAAFAGQWVRSRQRSRGLARRALAVELRRKGVDDEIAGEALAEVDDAAEEERARELVVRKLRTVPADTPDQRVTAARRLVGMLARKGYPGGTAYRVVREALAVHGIDLDELGEGPADD